MRQRGPGGKGKRGSKRAKGTGNYVRSTDGGMTEVTNETQADARAYRKSMKKKKNKNKF